MRTTVALLCTACALSLACAGNPPPRTHYLLRADDAAWGTSEAPGRVGLGRVTIPGYLDQAGIVVEEAPGQVQAAQLHLWAEPLELSLRSTLRAALSDALGFEVSSTRGNALSWDYVVDVDVDRLHAKMDGTALIDAGYEIIPRADAARRVEHRFSKTARLPREGYPGIVDAEARLVEELAKAIAASLEAARAGE